TLGERTAALHSPPFSEVVQPAPTAAHTSYFMVGSSAALAAAWNTSNTAEIAPTHARMILSPQSFIGQTTRSQASALPHLPFGRGPTHRMGGAAARMDAPPGACESPAGRVFATGPWGWTRQTRKRECWRGHLSQTKA